MTRVVIQELVFDEYNREHIKKHSVTEDEVKVAGKNIAYHKRSYKGRYMGTGRSGKRVLTIILNRLEQGKYYMVTARDADKKERRRLYEREKKK